MLKQLHHSETPLWKKGRGYCVEGRVHPEKNVSLCVSVLTGKAQRPLWGYLTLASSQHSQHFSTLPPNTYPTQTHRWPDSQPECITQQLGTTEKLTHRCAHVSLSLLSFFFLYPPTHFSMISAFLCQYYPLYTSAPMQFATRCPVLHSH